MAASALLVAAGIPVWIFSLAGAISFAALLVLGRGRWTPPGRFGAANLLTFARIGATALLPLLPAVPIGVAASILLAADGVDGRIARQRGLAGPFGEQADNEADAFLVLMLCVLLYRLPPGLGVWILAPGLMRYLFVGFVLLAHPPQERQRRTRKAAVISVVMHLALIACFLFHPAPAGLRWFAALAALGLAYSFGCSIAGMYRAEETAASSDPQEAPAPGPVTPDRTPPSRARSPTGAR